MMMESFLVLYYCTRSISCFRLISEVKKCRTDQYNTQRRLERSQNCNMELIELNDGLSEELMAVQLAIESDKNKRNVVDSLITETEKECGENFARRVRDAWEADNARNRPGSGGNRWHPLTLRVALAVYTRSPQAYTAWKEFQLFTLPSKRTLQRYIGNHFKTDPGICMEKFSMDVDRYWDDQGKKLRYPGKGEGVLIMDEVKIIGKMACNLKDKSINGVCTTSSELSSLRFVYVFYTIAVLIISDSFVGKKRI